MVVGSSMKIVTIVGARPQFIKAAVVSRAIENYNRQNSENLIDEVIVHTGQHYDNNMSDIFFTEMSIPKPKYSLHIGGGLHGAMTGKMLEQIETVLLKEKPNFVLVYGDTNSTLAGALAASKLHIPVAHVEAGLRSFNMDMPEEINRILTDRISQWLFCPTKTAVENLLKEGFENFSAKVECIGDVMYDAALFYKQDAKPSGKISELINRHGDFYLATIHRAENADNVERLRNIIEALDEIAKVRAVILPLHPRTKKVIKTANIKIKNIIMIEPVGYFDMISLLEKCLAVFTDSGGVQKEAYFFQKQCITLRNETEWIELVEHGFNQLVGAEKTKILQAEQNLKLINKDFSMQLYGDGKAGEKIVGELLKSNIKEG